MFKCKRNIFQSAFIFAAIVPLTLMVGCDDIKVEDIENRESIDHGNVFAVNESNFDSLVNNNSQLVVLDFSATWCGPCKQLYPTIVELSKEYEGKVTFGKVDVDKSPNLAQKFKASTIPHVVFLQHGKVVSGPIKGNAPKHHFQKEIGKLLK